MTASTGNAQPLPNPGLGDETPQGSDASDREATGPCSPANPSAGGATGTLGPELAPLLESLRTAADEDGLVCPRWRDLAGTLGVPIRTLRRRLVELVSRGALLAVGVDTYALPGTSAATLSAGEERDPPAARLPPHDAVHDLPGWMLPW